MRILIVTDAWHPQLNGVVRTIEATRAELQRRGHEVEVIGPDRFRSLPLPTYPDIRLSLAERGQIERLIEAFAPETIHIATEGPLGWRARAWCRRNRFAFTSAYHTRFPEYLAARAPVPLALGYAWLRRFHKPSAALMAPTQSVMDDLAKRGFANLALWTRGVDTDLFRPLESKTRESPILLYVGRVAVEKNIEAFLSLDVPGSKIVVGDGPQREALQQKYPATEFTGRLDGEALAQAYSRADVFVFPSATDTFGLVLLEALACGVKVAAYAVAGPRDVLAPQDLALPVGVLDDDLKTAVKRCLALQIPAVRCRDFVLRHYSWAIATDQFLQVGARAYNQSR